MTLRELKRPVVLFTVSTVCLVANHILLRTMAHGHTAQVLLSHGAAAPKTAVALALTLVIVRFISYILVPGMMLAAAAEVVAYGLVGPKREEDNPIESEQGDQSG